MTYEHESEAIGKGVANLLRLKFKAGRTATSWGSKTLTGLGASIRRIVDESRGAVVVGGDNSVDLSDMTNIT